MPATVVYGEYLFGQVAAPFNLPDGWAWIHSPENWLIARDPEGKQYMATKTELHLVVIRPAEMQLAEDTPTNYRPK